MNVRMCKTCGGTGTVDKAKLSDFDCLLERFDKFEHAMKVIDINRRFYSLEKWRETLSKQVEEVERRLEKIDPQVMFVVSSDGTPTRRASEQEMEAIRQLQATARALKKQQDIPFGFGVYQARTENEELRLVRTERDTLQSKLDEIKNTISTEGYYPAAVIRRILDK